MALYQTAEEAIVALKALFKGGEAFASPIEKYGDDIVKALESGDVETWLKTAAKDAKGADEAFLKSPKLKSHLVNTLNREGFSKDFKAAFDKGISAEELEVLRLKYKLPKTSPLVKNAETALAQRAAGKLPPPLPRTAATSLPEAAKETTEVAADGTVYKRGADGKTLKPNFGGGADAEAQAALKTGTDDLPVNAVGTTIKAADGTADDAMRVGDSVKPGPVASASTSPPLPPHTPAPAPTPSSSTSGAGGTGGTGGGSGRGGAGGTGGTGGTPPHGGAGAPHRATMTKFADDPGMAVPKTPNIFIRYEKAVANIPFIGKLMGFPVNAVRIFANLPTYIRRGISYPFAAENYTRALFNYFDTLKETSAVNLLMTVNPRRANLNFIHKTGKGADAVAVFDTQRAMKSVQDAVENLKAGKGTIGDVKAASQDLENHLSAIKRKVDTINADPRASNPHNMYNASDPGEGSRIVGGTVTARLAVHKAQPHLQALEKFSNDLAQDVATGTLDADAYAARAGAASQDLNKFEDTLVGFTTSEQSKGFGILGSPTNWAVRQDSGRIERELTRAEKQEVGQLMESGAIKKVDMDYKPGEGVTTKNVGNGEGKSGAQKFAEFAYARRQLYNIDPKDAQKFNDALKLANEDIVSNLETMLKAGDRNGVIETLKWIAVRYSTNVGGDSNRALGISSSLIKYIEANGNKALWDDELLNMVGHMRTKMEDTWGSNNFRYAWGEAVEYSRNRRFVGDFKNELTNPTSPNEYADALKWKWGLGLPFLPGRFAARGAPYYMFTYRIERPLTGIWQRLEGKKTLAPLGKWMWDHKKTSAFGLVAAIGLGTYTGIKLFSEDVPDMPTTARVLKVEGKTVLGLEMANIVNQAGTDGYKAGFAVPGVNGDDLARKAVAEALASPKNIGAAQIAALDAARAKANDILGDLKDVNEQTRLDAIKNNKDQLQEAARLAAEGHAEFRVRKILQLLEMKMDVDSPSSLNTKSEDIKNWVNTTAAAGMATVGIQYAPEATATFKEVAERVLSNNKDAMDAEVMDAVNDKVNTLIEKIKKAEPNVSDADLLNKLKREQAQVTDAAKIEKNKQLKEIVSKITGGMNAPATIMAVGAVAASAPTAAAAPTPAPTTPTPAATPAAAAGLVAGVPAAVIAPAPAAGTPVSGGSAAPGTPAPAGTPAPGAPAPAAPAPAAAGSPVVSAPATGTTAAATAPAATQPPADLGRIRDNFTTAGRKFLDKTINWSEGNPNGTMSVLFNSVTDMAVSGTKNTFSWLTDTFNSMKKTDGGRGTLQVLAAIAALFGGGAITSNLLDKWGPGKWPFVGAILKLGAALFVGLAIGKAVGNWLGQGSGTHTSSSIIAASGTSASQNTRDVSSFTSAPADSVAPVPYMGGSRTSTSTSVVPSLPAPASTPAAEEEIPVPAFRTSYVVPVQGHGKGSLTPSTFDPVTRSYTSIGNEEGIMQTLSPGNIVHMPTDLRQRMAGGHSVSVATLGHHNAGDNVYVMFGADGSHTPEPKPDHRALGLS